MGVIIGPGPVTAEDLDSAQTAVYLTDDEDIGAGIAAISDLLAKLNESTPLSKAIATVSGPLGWVGEDFKWQPPPLIRKRAEKHVSDSGNVTPVSSGASGDLPGVAIGVLNVNGDVIKDKVVYQADGDQYIRGEFHATRIEQKAGLDQVNINRVQSEGAHLGQTAAGDQVNIDRVRSSSRANVCPSCGNSVGANDNYCLTCGAPVNTTRDNIP